MDQIKRATKRDFFIAQNMIFGANISTHAKLTYLYLCRCTDDEGQAFPSYNTIARRCSFSRNTAINAITALRKVGLLAVVPRYHSQDGKVTSTSNLYTLYDSPDAAAASEARHTSPGGAPVQEVDYPSAGGGLPQSRRWTTPVHEVDYPSAGGGHITIPTYKDPFINTQLTSTLGCSGVPVEILQDGGEQGHKRQEPVNAGQDDGYSGEFEEFWSVYPRTKEKQAAYGQWRARLKEKHKPSDLIAAAREYAKEVVGKEQRYIKQAKTFLGANKPFVDYLKSLGGGRPNETPRNPEQATGTSKYRTGRFADVVE